MTSARCSRDRRSGFIAATDSKARGWESDAQAVPWTPDGHSEGRAGVEVDEQGRAVRVKTAPANSNAAGAWDLAPAYDVTHAHNPHGQWTSRHLMGIDGIFYNAGRDHLLRFADRFAVPSPRAIIDDINTAVAAWPAFARSAELPREPTHRILQDLRQM